MAFFRDDPYEDWVYSNETPAEKLERARWYVYCNYFVEAHRLLTDVAESIPDFKDENEYFYG